MRLRLIICILQINDLRLGLMTWHLLVLQLSLVVMVKNSCWGGSHAKYNISLMYSLLKLMEINFYHTSYNSKLLELEPLGSRS